jgi:hypothetical protein
MHPLLCLTLSLLLLLLLLTSCYHCILLPNPSSLLCVLMPRLLNNAG